MVLLDWATDVWATNRVPEANATEANKVEMLVFQNFIIVIGYKYYLANRLINFVFKIAEYRLAIEACFHSNITYIAVSFGD